MHTSLRVENRCELSALPQRTLENKQSTRWYRVLVQDRVQRLKNSPAVASIQRSFLCPMHFDASQWAKPAGVIDHCRQQMITSGHPNDEL